MAVADQILKNFNLFVAGRGFAGRVEELNLPKLALKTEDYQAGGMDAPIAIDVGMEKLEVSFTITGYDPSLTALFGNRSATNPVQLIARGSIESLDGSVESAEVVMQGIFTAVEGDPWKPGASSKVKYTANLRYYRFTQAGRVVHEIDLLNFKRIVSGVDQLAKQRAAIGL